MHRIYWCVELTSGKIYLEESGSTVIKKEAELIMDWNFTDNEHSTDVDDEYLFEEFGPYPDNISRAFSAVAGILITCGILENIMTIYILISKKKYLRSFANFHLLNLSITDILFRILAIPDLLKDQLIAGSDFTCKIGEFFRFTTLAVAFTILAGLAFDRYIHIVHPFRARAVTWKHSRNVIAMSWAYSLLCSAPFLYSVKREVEEDEETLEKLASCYDIPGSPSHISLSVFLLFSFTIPLVFMAVVYGKVVSVLWSRARRKMIDRRMEKTKMLAVKMMVVIVLTYLVTWGPKLVMKTMEVFNFEEDTTERGDSSGDEEEVEIDNDLLMSVLETTFEVLSLASSVLNPLIFGYYNGSFRREMKNIFLGIKRTKCCKKRSRRIGPRVQKIHVSSGSNETNLTNHGTS